MFCSESRCSVQHMLDLTHHSLLRVHHAHHHLQWQKQRQATSTSSGFCIEGRRILCNAHGVKFFRYVHLSYPPELQNCNAQLLSCR